MPKAQPLLLDLYHNAAVAYSLRKLRNAYLGSAIRVRRAIDNAEQDFGFDEINDTLTDWVGYNLWTYSEQIQQSVWTKTNLTVTTDTIVAPDGNTTGDILFETVTNGTHLINRTLTITAGNEYTISFWIKDEGRNHIRITTSSNFSQDGTGGNAWLDLSTGTIVSESSGFSGSNLTITPDGSWYKVSYTMPALATGSLTVLQLNLSPNGSTLTYTGDITKGVGIWGIQITQSSTLRPYRQTLAVAEGQGFITTWYDQSTNGNNAIQATAANQAQIVLNGNLILDVSTGKITSTWSNDRYNLTTGINTNTQYLSVSMHRIINSNDAMTHLGNSTASVTPLNLFGTGAFVYTVRSYMLNVLVHTSSASILGRNIITSLKNSSNLKMAYRNGVQLSNTVTEVPTSGTLNTFGQISTLYTSGQYQELIYWDSDQSANRIGIETEINNYYGIY
jgi:hypothetical protein